MDQLLLSLAEQGSQRTRFGTTGNVVGMQGWLTGCNQLTAGLHRRCIVDLDDPVSTDRGSDLTEKLRWLSVELLQYLESLLRLYKFGYRAACIAVIANELVARSGEFNGGVLPLFPTVHAFERDPCFLHTRRSTSDLY